MNEMKEKLRQIDAHPNIDAINEFNSITKLKLKKNVRPCFFTGNIEQKGTLVTISLNPKYTPEVTEREQEEYGNNFDEWYNFCLERFIQYKSSKDIHPVFKNLRKIILPTQEWKQGDPREDLQRDLINLDLCPYYSEKFPTFQLNQLPSLVQSWIKEIWMDILDQLLIKCSPRCIFASGRSIESWVRDHSSNLVSINEFKSSRGQKCQLWEGSLNGIRILYLEHFINSVNRNITLDQIGRILRDE